MTAGLTRHTNEIDRWFDALSAKLIGFDQLRPLIDGTLAQSGSFPPYDIVKTDEDTYLLTLAIAGFSKQDITISYEKDTLRISGEIQKTNDVYLFEGIAKRKFERRWNLGKHIEVDHASMKDGLLHITLVRNIPEEEKPKVIPIQTI